MPCKSRHTCPWYVSCHAAPQNEVLRDNPLNCAKETVVFKKLYNTTEVEPEDDQLKKHEA